MAAATQEVESRKLSLPFPLGETAATARGGLLDPTETHFVFTVQGTVSYDGPSINALYTVPVVGGNAVELFRYDANETLFFGFAGDRVAWGVGPTNEAGELYSAPVDGSQGAIFLTDVESPGAVEYGGTSGRAFFFEAVYGDGPGRLMAVDLDGRTPPSVLAIEAEGERFVGLDIQAGGHIVALQTLNQGVGLPRIMDVDGSSLVQVTGGIPVNSALMQYTPEGDFAVFASQTGTPEGLFFAPTDGSTAPLTFHAPLDPGRRVSSYRVDPEGRFVAYTETGNNLPRTLYTVDFAQGGRIREIVPPALLGFFFQFAPGGRVLFDVNAQGPDPLFAAPADGSLAPYSLTPDLGNVPLSTYVTETVLFTDDGEHAVVLTRRNLIYSAKLDGSEAPLVLVDPEPDSEPIEIRARSDGDEVFYRVPNTATTARLFAIRSDGSAPPRMVNVPLVPDGGVLSNYRLTSDRVVYAAEVRERGIHELISSPNRGAGQVARLNPELPIDPGGDVDRFLTTADDDRVVYVGTQFDRETLDMLAVDLGERGDPRPITRDLQPGQRVGTSVLLTADGERVVLTVDGELFSAARGGGETPVRLGPVQETLSTDFATSGDGPFVLFQDASVGFEWKTWIVPASGGQPRLFIDSGVVVVLNGLPRDFRFIGNRVLYAVGTGNSMRIETRSILDPSDVVVLAEGAGLRYELTPDRSTIVYHQVPGTEAFARSVDGQGSPVRLTPEGFADSVTGVNLDLDGIALIAAGPLLEVQLYGTPIDGSSPLEQLSDFDFARSLHVVAGSGHAIVTVGLPGVTRKFLIDVTGDSAPVEYVTESFVAITSLGVFDGDTFLFLGRDVDQGDSTPYALYRLILADGSLETVPSPPGQGVQQFAVVENDLGIVVRAREEFFTHIVPSFDGALYFLPADGSSQTLLTPDLVEGGGVRTFELVGTRVVYEADQDFDGVYELFTLEIPRERPDATPLGGNPRGIRR